MQKNTEDKTFTTSLNDDFSRDLMKTLRESTLGYTPLHAAASVAVQKKPSAFHNKNISYKEGEIISLLIKHKANVNAKSKTGNTTLHRASTAKAADILIKHGAKLNIRNHHGNTPLHSAIY